MKIHWILIGFFLLLGCARTQVVNIGSGEQIKQYVTVGPINDIEQPQVAAEQTASEQSTTPQEDSESSSHKTSSTSQTSQSSAQQSSNIQSSNKTALQNNSINPADEYIVTSCCAQGRLFAQTKKIKSEYTVDNIKSILLDIYYKYCDDLNQTREYIYLRFYDELQDSAYLVHYKDSSIKKIMLDGKIIDNTFKLCD